MRELSRWDTRKGIIIVNKAEKLYQRNGNANAGNIEWNSRYSNTKFHLSGKDLDCTLIGS